jgi:hypothetical protein
MDSAAKSVETAARKGKIGKRPDPVSVLYDQANHTPHNLRHVADSG